MTKFQLSILLYFFQITDLTGLLSCYWLKEASKVKILFYHHMVAWILYVVGTDRVFFSLSLIPGGGVLV